MSAAERTHQAQCATGVLMVRPAHFASNPETAASNRFQRSAPADPLIADQARAEFDALAASLADHGVEVHALGGDRHAMLPDEIFPNNWVSFHADGTVALYPMMAPVRRRERRPELLRELADRTDHDVRRVVDLTPYEASGQFLEGTGSVVFDHVHGTAYACRSPRTHEAPLGALCRALGFRSIVFDATDRDDVPVYHTNVLMSVGPQFAVLCAEAIVDPAQRETVRSQLAAGGRELIEIDIARMHEFAANLLALRGRRRLIALSRRACDALGRSLRARLAAHGDLLVADVEAIEKLGGGSVRCMLAELFLPPRVAGQRRREPSAIQID